MFSLNNLLIFLQKWLCLLMFLVGPRFILSKLVRFAIFFTHITMVFTMYRIYNRQRKQEKTERVLPLSHKHFIPPLYTYVYRKDQVSPVPGLFVFYSRPPRFALYCLLPQAGSSLIVQEKQMSASQPLVFLLDSLHPHLE